jgi:membrane protein implicated in regulation of membrane protease activity
MLKKLKAVIVGTVALCLKTVAVIAFLVAITVAMLLAPRFMPVPNAWAEYSSGAIKALSSLTGQPENILSSNGALYAFGQLLSYEDTINSVGRVETQMGNATCSAVTADLQCKSGQTFLNTVTFSQTSSAAPVAGVLTIYDSLTETGTVIWSGYFSTAVLVPFTITLNRVATTGIYVGYDGTLSGIKTSVSSR